MSDLSFGVELSRELIGFNTINPPGNERACIEHVGQHLNGLGFEVALHDFGPDRANLVARLPATSPDRKPLVFSGHVDTVPLGHASWSVPPFAGMIADGRLYGRGSSDMKTGVAAFVAAAAALTRMPERRADIVHVITAGEETGSEGAAWLAARPELLGDCGAMIVAEPTDNRPMIGHKGALWMHLVTTGVTAHGSMPDRGVNAIARAADLVAALTAHEFSIDPHPVMGPPTLNVGTISGGININSVPDRAVVGVDIRTIAGQTNSRVRDAVAGVVGADIGIESVVDMGPVYSDPDDPWIRSVFARIAELSGAEPGVETAAYFTDASILTPAYGDPPTIIMGPGPMAMAHQTDEYCEIERLEACVGIFTAIARDYLA